MLARVDEALRGPRGQSLATVLRERWRYVAIDEFQDTDETQWSIFRRAFFEPQPPRSVAVLIGDPKQSIYRFRGADVQTYLRAQATTIAHGVPLVRLEHNFRATPALVDAQNVLFDAHAPAPLFTGEIQYSPVLAGQLQRSFVDGEGRSVSPVHVLRFVAPRNPAALLPDLGNRIAREIRSLTDERKPFRFDGRAIGFSDVMVLTRTKKEARTIGDALRRGGVPYAFYKEGGLYQSDQAKDILTLLRAIDEPNDAGKRLAAWLGPFFDVPLRDLERARDLPFTHPLHARLLAWRSLAERCDFECLFPRIVEQSGIVRRLLFFAVGEREITNVLHLFELLLERAQSTGENLRDLALFLGRLVDETQSAEDVDADVQRLESERRAVQIMTIHKAKGLEAPVVFLAGGWSKGPTDSVHVYHEGDRRVAWVGTMPDSVKARVAVEEAEDGQRLMYVALTRAMGRVYLPHAVVSDTAPTAGDSVEGRGAVDWTGPYGAVNRRLTDVLASGAAWFTVEGEEGASRPHASSPEGIANEDMSSTAAERRSGGAWEPPAKWLGKTPDNRRYAELRERGAAAVMTSYTRLHRQRDLRSPWPDEEPEAPRSSRAADSVDETILQSSRISGIFLHEVLERVPVSSFVANDFALWRALPDVVALLDEAMNIFSIARTQREHAARLVWTAFTTPVRLPGGGEIDGFARAERMTREMAFVYATPRADDRVRVFARGSIDLAFEHDGRTHFVDWKSDALKAYDFATLTDHVNAHYEDQVELYTLAVVELLGVETEREYEARFGGILYSFLRAMGPRGVWSTRPSWKDVLTWKDGLTERLASTQAPGLR